VTAVIATFSKARRDSLKREVIWFALSAAACAATVILSFIAITRKAGTGFTTRHG
jgi:hypothetical protein